MRKRAGIRAASDGNVLILGLPELIVIPDITRKVWAERMIGNIPFVDLERKRSLKAMQEGEDVIRYLGLMDELETMCERHEVPPEEVCAEMMIWDGEKNRLILDEKEIYACSPQPFTTHDEKPGIYVRIDESSSYMHLRQRTGDTTWNEWADRSSRIEAMFKGANKMSEGGGSWLEVIFQ